MSAFENLRKARSLYRGLSRAQHDILDTWAKQQVADYLTCQTALVTELEAKNFDGFTIDDLQNVYPPEAPESEDLEVMGIQDLISVTEELCVFQHLDKEVPILDYVISDMPEVPEERLAELVRNWRSDPSGENLAEIEDWFDTEGYTEAVQGFILTNSDDSDRDPQEVFEWWLVDSKWLSERLLEIGEPILDNGLGVWWGRTCTGQSIYLDSTLQLVYLHAYGVPVVEAPKVDTETEFATRYPQHAKLKAVEDEAQAQGEFLELVLGKYALAKWHGDQLLTINLTDTGINKLLAEYHGVDYQALQEEKRQMLNELSEASRG